MAARSVELAEDVAGWLAANSFKFGFLVVRQNPTTVTLEGSNDTHLFVYPGPRGPSIGEGTRGRPLWNYSVLIHLVNYQDSKTQQEHDNAHELIEEIEQRIFGLVTTTPPIASIQAFGTDDSPEEFANQNQLLETNLLQHVLTVIFAPKLS